MRLFALVLLFISQIGFAKELTFKFDIYSSGPMIYACNAGLRHYKNQCSQVCHLAGRPAIREYLCQRGDHDCVCTGTNGGAYLMDFMRFQYRKWNGGVWSANANRGALQAQTNQSYAEVSQLAENYLNPLDTKLDQVNFNLGSEQYGANFFVDICFRGSQIDYYSPDNLLSVATSNLAKAAVTVTDVTSLSPGNPVGPGGVPGTFLDYLKLSGLQAKATILCDVQGHGQYKYAHNGGTAYQGDYDTLDNELNFVSGQEQSNRGHNFFYTSNWIRPSASTQVLANVWINRNTPHHPRFCVVRYHFEETTCAERKWQRHDARVCLQTSIEEAVAEGE